MARAKAKARERCVVNGAEVGGGEFGSLTCFLVEKLVTALG